jgi:hypothetical protein
MEKRAINPPPWLLELGVNHGVEVTSANGHCIYLAKLQPLVTVGRCMKEIYPLNSNLRGRISSKR